MDAEKFKDVREDFTQDELQQLLASPEAVQYDIIQKFDRINRMNETELVDKLKCFHLNTQGSVDALRTRLKNSYKKITLAAVDLFVSKELLPYYVIIDFEATCDEVNPPKFRHEIIEFPAVIVNTRQQKIEDCFQMYCKPKLNPVISKFCTELTGITQEQVDAADSFENVFNHFQDWLANHNLGKKHKYAIVTDGPWDMSRFLFSQCHYSNIKFPKWGAKWVNLKKIFCKFYKCERICLKNMIEFLGMEFEGKPHCGLDDAKNIARILLRMIYDGANIQINERITVSQKQKENMKKACEAVNVINEECEKRDLSNKMENLRLEAHYTAVYYVGKTPLYKEVKRERLIAEAQLARKMFKNSEICNSENKTEHKRKRKSLMT